MILVYASVDPVGNLDRVNITEDSVTFETGKAKTAIDSAVARYGLRGTMELYRDWSNGYVTFHEEV